MPRANVKEHLATLPGEQRMTVQQVARLMGLSRTRIYEFIEQQRLHTIHTTGEVGGGEFHTGQLITVGELRRFMAEDYNQPGRPKTKRTPAPVFSDPLQGATT